MYFCPYIYERYIKKEIPSTWGNQLLYSHMLEQQQIV